MGSNSMSVSRSPLRCSCFSTCLVLTVAALGCGVETRDVPQVPPVPVDDADGWFWAIRAYPNGIPRGARAETLREIERLEAGDARRMLITGVNRDVKPSELAAEYGRPVAVFDCCVSLGFDASDTRSNALEVSRWLVRRKYKSIRLVTADWHMRRARYELERVLPDDVKIYDDGVRSTPSLATLWKEYNKYVLRRLGAVLGL